MVQNSPESGLAGTLRDRLHEGKVTSIPILSMLDWLTWSNHALKSYDADPNTPVIVLPPLQRGPVWRPKQVVEFWRSLFDGLPVGMLYISRLTGNARSFSIKDGRIAKLDRPGFELLDGQQRMRALRLAAGVDSVKDERRCLWLHLPPKGGYELYLTSQAQPFGYKPEDGSRWLLNTRRAARERLERDLEGRPLLFVGDKNQAASEMVPRRAFDRDLFLGKLEPPEKAMPEPWPKDGDAKVGHSQGRFYKLHELLATWRFCGGYDGLEKFLVSQQDEVPTATVEGLHQAFQNLDRSAIVLLRMRDDLFEGDNGKKRLLTLFTRIGAGGTPLTAEEQLYSAYKHYCPEIGNVVEAIHNDCGRVLSPTRIATTALLLANIQAGKSFSVPSMEEFVAAATDQCKGRKLWTELQKLLPSEGAGILATAFKSVKARLKWSADVCGDERDIYWIPDALLGSLPAGLWQVLVFWAVQSPNKVNTRTTRERLVRFALFWHYAVWNNEKAASRALQRLKGMGEEVEFPDRELYLDLIGRGSDSPCAVGFADATTFYEALPKRCPSPRWRKDRERFAKAGDGGKDSVRNESAAHWWWGGWKVLPWLQRRYVQEAFPGYAPLSDHEDDLPYDLDHICPKSHWDWHWGSKNAKCFIVVADNADEIRQGMYDGRGDLGNGIGNLRVVESSHNRRDQDKDHREKMPEKVQVSAKEDRDLATQMELADWTFGTDRDELSWWLAAGVLPGTTEMSDDKGKYWDCRRLEALQAAAERRAARLYRDFYHGLGFADWRDNEVASPSGQLEEPGVGKPI